MRTGRPTQPLNMTCDERESLQRWARRRKSSQQLALRSRIVLLCDEGLTNTQVSQKLRVCLPTVGKWRERFRVHRLEGLADEPRPGAPRTVTDAQIEEVIVRTLESTPPNATHWSTRGMAAVTGPVAQTKMLRCPCLSESAGPDPCRTAGSPQGDICFLVARYSPLGKPPGMA